MSLTGKEIGMNNAGSHFDGSMWGSPPLGSLFFRDTGSKTIS